MARIAFILLCHKDPDAVVQQAQQLTAAGDYIAIHFDASASADAFAQIKDALGDNPNVVFAKRRIKCGWGEWSLVQATLNAVEAAVEAFPRASHFYMVSGDCMAIKSARYAHEFLDEHDSDFIESHDFFESKWIKTGFVEERLIYRHFFNERAQKWLFYQSFHLQKRLGLTRKIPSDLQIMIGSQWWCLRRNTIEQILEFTRARRDVMRFFRTTWIPDETFFQTLVRHIVPSTQIENRTLTFLMFSDYGMPVTFYNDHYDLLLGQDALFARKISPQARELRTRLGELYASDRSDFVISNEGRNLFRFLTGQGRIGKRFAPRFWEDGATLGRDRELLIIACKKWHVAKRLVESIRRHTNVPALEYLFDEEATPLPELGGIEASLAKRGRHRRALIRLLFDHYESDRLVICLDTARLDLLEDFYADSATTRLLEIACSFDDDYLIGHAKRVGLVGDQTAAETLARLLPAIRHDIIHQRDAIRDAKLPGAARISDRAPLSDNAAALVQFLTVHHDVAETLANTPHLFTD
ncbi:DUF5928 domain-containing protein [Yoonia sediminilitoris]|uniref:Peptide O-xylosyltransferase n=1 Tax=Yoonia sediminilitoris TaxID=1286148 RepID=A0A2T6K7Y5_9RHOB|nr:DUF5928 domain-containing protein [Yoonia sediminilitoris]PUB10860.1 core-2/I-Branching enzyme [Yoonia sediminilitoris]RCW90535.1 core-2/I-Branching enzyme [Yoonia sediminilitoris]